jgi:hypothetical protein
MKVKEYTVLTDCVERGVAFGMSRAYKHSDTPTLDYIKRQIEDAVLVEICEYFNFNDEVFMEIDK